ncbi:SET domain-containing protein, partial [Amniculicola lignicola CBS 123094]
ERAPFFPCDHKGTCHEAKCRCYSEDIVCEKSCACPASCNRRFHGCTCAQKERPRPCGTEATCECVALNRECDPELCGTCGALEVLDPINRYISNESVKHLCDNVAIQRAVAAKTYLGHSSVHGFGLYTGEPLTINQFIGEYKGEVVTAKEGDRRGAIYQYKMTNYLFDLNRRQENDSMRAGNKFRFVNNASDKHSNCHARMVLCNGIVRIGFYASKSIKSGTELFFNYNYDEEQKTNFREP